MQNANYRMEIWTESEICIELAAVVVQTENIQLYAERLNDPMLAQNIHKLRYIVRMGENNFFTNKLQTSLAVASVLV